MIRRATTLGTSSDACSGGTPEVRPKGPVLDVSPYQVRITWMRARMAKQARISMGRVCCSRVVAPRSAGPLTPRRNAVGDRLTLDPSIPAIGGHRGWPGKFSTKTSNAALTDRLEPRSSARAEPRALPGQDDLNGGQRGKGEENCSRQGHRFHRAGAAERRRWQSRERPGSNPTARANRDSGLAKQHLPYPYIWCEVLRALTQARIEKNLGFWVGVRRCRAREDDVDNR